jgi:hypothetical protein
MLIAWTGTLQLMHEFGATTGNKTVYVVNASRAMMMAMKNMSTQD